MRFCTATGPTPRSRVGAKRNPGEWQAPRDDKERWFPVSHTIPAVPSKDRIWVIQDRLPMDLLWYLSSAKVEGLSWRTIAEMVGEDTGVSVSGSTLRRFLRAAAPIVAGVPLDESVDAYMVRSSR